MCDERRAYRGHFIRLIDQDLKHYAAQFGGLEAEPLTALAASIATSPSVRPFLQSAALVVRTTPQPVLGFLGNLPESLQPLLQAQTVALCHALRNLRVFTYQEIEKHCRVLAAALVAELGIDEVGKASFSAIPRGGAFVRGMLSYLLDLRPEQLLPSSNSECQVVIDDCALSGTRFRDHLRHVPRGSVVFATLVSPVELRRRIEEQEPRVRCCLGAVDLEEREIDHLKPGWRERWLEQREGFGYWIGRFEALVFPWSEPERFLWDPVHEKSETAWGVTPPGLRLSSPPEGAFQIQPEGPGPLKPTDEVLFGELDGAVLVGHMGTEDVIRLEDTAADMWRTVVKTGTVNGAVQTLLAEYEVHEGTLRPDVESFVEELLERGLLTDERSR